MRPQNFFDNQGIKEAQHTEEEFSPVKQRFNAHDLEKSQGTAQEEEEQGEENYDEGEEEEQREGDQEEEDEEYEGEEHEKYQSEEIKSREYAEEVKSFLKMNGND